ncbi:hypothetical protein BaRGS_00018805 [Batillaria attramentaria]|uniref:Uncharacterized protein n=1 Tax=Batillaria attramentaria TaxID=370345 RepID=A0ABD0KSY4_9CAEN
MHHQKDLVKRGVLWEDEEFPANSKSLYFSKVDNTVQWMRPKELCKVPRLIEDCVTCNDLDPGELGNNWLLTACAAIAKDKKALAKVVPDHKLQEWDDKNQYAGIFKFSFWRFVAQRVLVRLLEKAYAKLYGDYESLGHCYTLDSLVDFTGGVAERIEINSLLLNDEGRQAFFKRLQDALDAGDFLLSRVESLKEDFDEEPEEDNESYSVTAIKFIEVNKNLQANTGFTTLKLVRLLNPWKDREWTGPWSNTSPMWKGISVEDWEKMGVKFKQEGEFWMSWDDFLTYFTRVELCHIINTSFFSMSKAWHESVLHSAWTTSGRNGGGDFASATVLSNPQYMFDINSHEDTIMISLDQHDVKGRDALMDNINTIGFHVMKVEANRRFRCHVTGKLKFSSEFKKLRSAYGTKDLVRGRYVIIPCTQEKDKVGEFILRLYTPYKPAATELTEDVPIVSCPCIAPYRMVTTITVETCADLLLEDIDTTPDPFVIIKCEGEKVQSYHESQTHNPEFNFMATFYRKKPAVPIFIEVMHKKKFGSELISTGACDENGTETGERKELVLSAKDKTMNLAKTGKMIVFVRSSFDLAAL